MSRRYPQNLPTLWLVTDERVPDEALLASAARLPKGRAGILFRHYRTAPADRRALFDLMRSIARRRRLMLLLAGPAQEARAWGADGWHGRAQGRAGGRLLHSMAVHDAAELQAAVRARADLVFLSPLFATRSHPGAASLGRVRFAALAHRAPMPVIALGGVRGVHLRMVRGLGASGWAAIDGLTGRGGFKA